MYDYANLLFTGKKCNLRCYDCIGQHPELKGLPSNIDEFPPKNINSLIEQVNLHNIRDLAVTGTNTDPQLYMHEAELIQYIRSRLTKNTKLSLHTNGLLALKKIDVFNSYDKASITFHSFNPEIYHKITGSDKQPDLRQIIQESKIPIKLSMLITPYNIEEMDSYIKKTSELGIKRVVIRKLEGKEDEYPLERLEPFKNINPIKYIYGWPVYNINGIEVTICGFSNVQASVLYLFSDGRLSNRLKQK